MIRPKASLVHFTRLAFCSQEVIMPVEKLGRV
jgi:hypothetical protein